MNREQMRANPEAVCCKHCREAVFLDGYGREWVHAATGRAVCTWRGRALYSAEPVMRVRS